MNETKKKRRWLKRFFVFFMSLILLLVSLLLLISYNSGIQTYIVSKVNEELKERFDVDVKIDNVRFELIKSLDFKGVLIRDHHQDTLFYANSVEADLELISIKDLSFNLDEFNVSEAKSKVILYKEDSLNSFNVLLEKFKTDRSSNTPFLVNVDDVSIEDLDVFYVDQKKDTIISFLNTEVSLEDLLLKGKDVFVDEYIVKTQFNKLNKVELSGKFELDSNVVKLRQAKNSFNDSKIDLEGEYDLTKHVFDVSLELSVERNDIECFVPIINPQIGDKFKLNTELIGAQDVINFDYLSVSNDYASFIGEASLSDFKSLNFTLKGDAEFLDLEDFQNRFELKGLNPVVDIKIPLNLSGDKNKIIGDVKISQSNSSLKNTFEFNVSKRFLTVGSQGALVLSEILEGIPYSSVLLNNYLEFDLRKLQYINNSSIRNLSYDTLSVSDIVCSIDGQNENLIYALEINDRNLSFNASGTSRFSDTLTLSSKFKLGKLYPSRLGLISGRDKNLRFQTNGFANIKISSVGDFTGFVQLSDFKYKELVYRQNLDHLSFNFSQSDKSTLSLFSDWINVKAKGEYKFGEIASVIKEMGESFQKGELPDLQEEINFSLDVPRLYPLAKIADFDADAYSFYAEGQISDSSHLSLTVDSLRYKNKKVKSLSVQVTTDKAEGLVCQLKTDSVKISDKPLFNSFANKLRIQDRVIYNSVYWDASDEKKSNGLLSINSDFSKDTLAINITKGEFYVNDMHWFLNNNEPIVFEDKRIVVNNIALNHKAESLRLYGVLGEEESDSINFQLDHLELETFRPLLDLINLKIDGVADGLVSIKSFLSNPETDSYLKISEFKLNSKPYKDLNISSKYDPIDKKVNLEAYLEASRGKRPLKVIGEYYPFKEKESLNAMISFETFNLRSVSNYFESFATVNKGSLNGDVLLKGTPSDFYLLGYLRTSKADLLIDYLGVPIEIENQQKIYFNKEGISFNNLKIKDKVGGNKAYLSGSLLHSNFSNFMFDLNLEFDQFTCLNTSKNQNDLYYGNVIASGNMSVTGNQDNILIDVNAKTDQFKKGRDLYTSHFVIPFESSTTVGSQEFLTFKSADPVKANKVQESFISNGLELRMKLDVGDEAEMKLVFDSQVGDQIRAKGSANLQLNLTTQGKFEMYGDYTVSEGEYLFTMESVINKKFKVKEGGTVSWTGDPYSGIMNMEAYYEVKTSLFDLLQYTVQEQDSTIQAQRFEDLKREYSKNSIVHCLMSMSGDVMRPEIVMDLDFLDIDEKTKLTIGSLISTEDEKMKQLVSLMIWGRFLPPSQFSGSGGFINAGVNTTTNELISNQIDLWISQLSDDVDLGFNYDRANTLEGRDEISLEIGKRLNDRISFSGNFGVANRNHQSGLIGEFEVDYRITENVRLKGFNENNDIDPSKVTGYTQGASVEYKAEFDDFQELIEPIRNFLNLFKVFETESKSVR